MSISLTKPAVGSLNWSTVVNQNFTDVENVLNRSIHDAPGLYGDGSDGSATINANTTLTRDMFYTTLTVQSPAVLTTGGYRIYAKTSVTVDAGGTISNSAAGNAPGTIGGGGNGGGLFGPGSDVDWGLGGAGASATGAGGVVNAPSADFGGLRFYAQASTGLFFNETENALVRGGAGGGGGTSGNGGNGGGVLILATPSLTNNGSIEAKGGNGTGDGGGGGGGVVILLYGTKTGSGTTSVAGGTGGSGVGAGSLIEVTN